MFKFGQKVKIVNRPFFEDVEVIVRERRDEKDEISYVVELDGGWYPVGPGSGDASTGPSPRAA